MNATTKTFPSAGAYRAAVNAGTYPAPKVDPYVVATTKQFTRLALKHGLELGTATYAAYMNGGEK